MKKQRGKGLGKKTVTKSLLRSKGSKIAKTLPREEIEKWGKGHGVREKLH